ncbi:LPXTG-motif cell wall-anchored protein [Mucilaginibacter sp. UYP25]|uniref:LPXTG cell wall anchor domain-containing protein n=1 Tax=unclassified Mucilaginibacter TaxID=2617802 RepID=UPI0033932D2E
MKNPFKEKDNSGILIAGLAIGAMFAGAITYLYIRKKREINQAADELKEHAKDYLKKKVKKKLKTEIKAL